ncbi:MAG: MFS transporter [Planctomycetaceae bacterium]|nr:MFS transporter [Planctomycetaceae bacterium]
MSQPSTWTKTIVASMTSYIDAGSIVAGGAGVMLWQEYLGMDEYKVGFFSALGPNALGAAIGALIGGRICDLYGRKLVYTYDLVFYILGMLLVIFAVNFPMLLIGYIIVGISVGADVAASWTLIAENAPAENRARHCGTAQFMWALGPCVVLMLSAIVNYFGLGLLGNRLVFAHLAVIAFIVWIMRLRMPESEEWKSNKEKEKELIASGVWQKTSYWDLFTNRVNLRGLLLLIGVYMIWNLSAGTMGGLLPYIYSNAGGLSTTASQALPALLFGTSCLATLFIFMTLADKYSRRVIFCVVANLFILAWGLFLLPAAWMGMPVFVMIAVLMGINNGSGQQAFYQMWAAEMFPARYRAAAQGFSFFTARFCLSIWLFIVPVLMAKSGMTIVAVILVAFAAISMLIGTIFCPNTAGKTLEQIENERYGGGK